MRIKALIAFFLAVSTHCAYANPGAAAAAVVMMSSAQQHQPRQAQTPKREPSARIPTGVAERIHYYETHGWACQIEYLNEASQAVAIKTNCFRKKAGS